MPRRRGGDAASGGGRGAGGEEGGEDVGGGDHATHVPILVDAHELRHVGVSETLEGDRERVRRAAREKADLGVGVGSVCSPSQQRPRTA